MNQKYYIQTIVAIIVNVSLFHTNAQSIQYEFEKWPGKNGKVKTNIEFPSKLITEHELKLTKGSTNTALTFKIPDIINNRNGRISIKTYDNIELAQSSLVEYLDCIVSDDKPKRITNDNDNIIGDVLYIKDYNYYTRIIFTRNNCLIIIYAPSNKAIQIAKTIDNSILEAPEYINSESRPSFKDVK